MTASAEIGTNDCPTRREVGADELAEIGFGEFGCVFHGVPLWVE
jgi:hypothetical protein